MNPIIKSSFLFSIVAIFFVILMFCILLLLNKNPVIYSSNIIFLGPMIAVFLFLAIKSFKDGNTEGLRFWQGFSIGMLYTFFFASFYGLVLYVYGAFFDQVHFDEYRAMIIEKIMVGKDMLVEQMGEEGYQEYLKSGNSSNERIIGSLLVNNLIIGVLVTPLISLFMRTPEPKRQ